MAIEFYTRSVTILTSLYGLLFGFISVIFYFAALTENAEAGLQTISFGVVALFAFGFLFLQFLISPWLMDLQLRWIYGMSWVSLEELPQSMFDAIVQTQEKYGFSIGKIGIIHDGMPNAFTYGRFRGGARIVFTEGLIDMLDPDEQAAVVQHELGHIVNYDFFFMTLASAVPLLFYYFYRTGRSAAASMSRAQKATGSSGKGKTNPAPIIYAMAAVAYFIYRLSHYIVLLLSRYREHAADTFSARETNEPGALSTALVKIAYGLVTSDRERQLRLEDESISRQERRDIQRRRGYTSAISTMGLADMKMSKGLAMQAAAGGGQVSPETVAKAATWDLKTPWAKFIELSSTHPLTGKRLKAIDDEAERMGVKRKYPDLGTVQPPESLWDEFLVDLFVGYVLPLFILVFPLVGLIIAIAFGYGPNLGIGAGIGLFALFWYLRVRIKYPGEINRYDDPNRTPNTVVEALSSMERDGYYEASPVRGKPIVIQGTVGGRGQPGFVIGEDFMVRDETGFIVIDFSSIIPFYNLWFGWRHVKKMMGKRVRVVGWYHRSIMPRIQLHRLYLLEEDKMKKNRWRALNLFFVLLMLMISAILILGIVVLI